MNNNTLNTDKTNNNNEHICKQQETNNAQIQKHMKQYKQHIHETTTAFFDFYVSGRRAGVRFWTFNFEN